MPLKDKTGQPLPDPEIEYKETDAHYSAGFKAREQARLAELRKIVDKSRKPSTAP